MNSALFVSTLVSFTLLLSKLSGLLRESLLASKLGVSATADAVVLLLTLPDFMVGLLLSGGISASLIPLLKQNGGVKRLFVLRRAAFLITLLFLGLAAFLANFSEFIIRLFIPTVDFSGLPGFIFGFNVSMIALPVAALIGVSASYLQAVGRFAVPSLSVLVFNGIICVYLMLPSINPNNLINFATAILIAASFRLLFHLSFMPETMRKLPGRTPLLPEGFIRRFIVGTFGFSVITASVIIFRSLHALNGDGQVAAFNFAHKLFQLPTGFLIGPLTVVLLQVLSGLGSDESFRDHTYKGVLAGFTLACIAATLGWIFMPTAVQLIFEHGVMTIDESSTIINLARSIFLALPFYSILHITAIAINANGRPILVVINSAIGLVTGVALTGLLTYIGFLATAASMGFVLFHVIAALLCLSNIFGWRFPTKNTILAIIEVLTKITAVTTLLLYLHNLSSSTSVWLQAVLFCFSALLMLAMNFKMIKPLVAMKVNKD